MPERVPYRDRPVSREGRRVYLINVNGHPEYVGANSEAELVQAVKDHALPKDIPVRVAERAAREAWTYTTSEHRTSKSLLNVLLA